MLWQGKRLGRSWIRRLRLAWRCWMRRGCWSFWRRGRLRFRGVGFGLGGAGLTVAAEAAGLHCCDGFRVLHEGLPDEGGAEIFCHEQADSQIDAEDVRVVPVQVGVE